MRLHVGIYTMVAFLLAIARVTGQAESTERKKLHSTILNEDRELLLYAPVHTVPQSLPLIIVFDGESLFGTTVAALRFMNYSSELPQMPEAVVVGIPNTNRDRDMPQPQQYSADKEDNFRGFVRDELIPYLKKQYTLNGHVIVMGHSQGGLFVSHLLATSPGNFQWAVALDAPVSVDSKTKNLKQEIAKTIQLSSGKHRYISIESLYGWENDWQLFQDTNQAIRIKLSGETHESMAFKGIYDGLKSAFHDFTPGRKDLALNELKNHYQAISENYGFVYQTPLKILLASARRKITENRKDEVMELLAYAEKEYGTGDRLTKLKADAGNIKSGPDALIDHYLHLPKPLPALASGYFGRWTGEMIVPDGVNMPVDIEIKEEQGQVKILSVIPWDTTKKEALEIVSINPDKSILFGRRNQGGGLMISNAIIDKNGDLSGKEEWIGFTIPDNLSEEIKQKLAFIQKNPNTFRLKRKEGSMPISKN